MRWISWALSLAADPGTNTLYILVICDYATCYPEAVPLRSIDAEEVAGELTKLFARVGVPEEVLKDQGSNFMSQLLAEVYRMIHINADMAESISSTS